MKADEGAGMSHRSTTDPKFLSELESWLVRGSEILLLIRYSRWAGAKDFEFFSSWPAVAERLRALPPLACVTAFRQLQLLLHGIVDEEFVRRCLESIPDGEEYLVLAVRGEGTKSSYLAGESHAELSADLETCAGLEVRVGLYPPWLVDDEDVISAVVPDAGGETVGGVY